MKTDAKITQDIYEAIDYLEKQVDMGRHAHMYLTYADGGLTFKPSKINGISFSKNGHALDCKEGNVIFDPARHAIQLGFSSIDRLDFEESLEVAQATLAHWEQRYQETENPGAKGTVTKKFINPAKKAIKEWQDKIAQCPANPINPVYAIDHEIKHMKDMASGLSRSVTRTIESLIDVDPVDINHKRSLSSGMYTDSAKLGVLNNIIMRLEDETDYDKFMQAITAEEKLQVNMVLYNYSANAHESDKEEQQARSWLIRAIIRPAIKSLKAYEAGIASWNFLKEAGVDMDAIS